MFPIFGYKTSERLLPLLKSKKLGTITIGSPTEEFDWIYIKNIVKETDYRIANRNEWNTLFNNLNLTSV